MRLLIDQFIVYLFSYLSLHLPAFIFLTIMDLRNDPQVPFRNSEDAKIIFHSPTRRMIWSVSELYCLPRSALSRLAGQSWLDKGKPSGGQEKGLNRHPSREKWAPVKHLQGLGKVWDKTPKCHPTFLLAAPPFACVCVDTITCSPKFYHHFHHCPSFGLPLMPRSVYAESIVYPKEEGNWWRNLAEDFKY